MCCCLQWIRRLWPQRPPNDDQLRRQLAQVRELDKQHREAFEHLLRMFEWEVADRKDGYYETGLDIPYDEQPQEKDKDNRT
jgi:thioredoxin-like negative regulator of GroEL